MLLGWAPEISFEDGLNEAIEWYSILEEKLAVAGQGKIAGARRDRTR